MPKHQLLIIASVIFILPGCLGPKKINKWVDTQYGETVSFQAKMKSEYLSVKSGLITSDPKPSTTEKQTKNFLPLLFYWQFDYMNTCTLNPAIPINTFSSTVQSYANAKGMKQKLNGQTIELVVDKIPNVFLLNDRGHLIWLIYAFGWDQITYIPDNNQMVVSYKVFKNNAPTKTGTISIPNADKTLKVKYMQSIKKATGQYLEQYDESIKLMSKQVVDKIITEI